MLKQFGTIVPTKMPNHAEYTVTVTDAGIRGIDKRTVCIVRFHQPLSINDIKPGIFYQVTIDPKEISGDFIRFGGQGDELIGWQPLDFIRVCHVIAQENEEGELKKVLPSNSVTLIENWSNG